MTRFEASVVAAHRPAGHGALRLPRDPAPAGP